ncbi:MAG: M20/M25/M40 family metallo-hydrolase, partial [Burkholderiales bacterium]
GAGNVIPGEVELRFNFRFSTASTVDDLKIQTEQTLGRRGLDYSLEWTLSAKPYLTPRGVLADRLSQAIKQVTGVTAELSTTGGTSDGRFISDICDEVVELGPINATIHKIDECVALADIESLREIYQRTLADLLVS